MKNQASNFGSEKKDNKGAGVAAGVGVGAGVAGGIIGGTVMANAAETDDANGVNIIDESGDVKADVAQDVHPVEEHHHHHHHTENFETHVHIHDSEVIPEEPVLIQEPGGEEPEVQVVDYQRVDDGEGGQMDVAVIDVNGEGMLIIDENMNGYADYMAADFNRNGEIEQDEIIDVRDSGISMQPFQDAAGFEDPMLAQNDADMPDYTNDADVDSFMA